MAIYHLNVSIGSRGGGQSAAAKSDYIEREGKYAKGAEEIAYVEHGHMPEFAAKSPRQYWEAADLYERENGRLFRQVEFALPVELTLEEQIALAHDFAQHLTAAEKMPYTLAIHKGAYDHQGKATDTPENPHVHLIISERANDGIERSAEQWFKRANKKQPERGGAAKTKVMENRDWLLATRALWADMANNALERAESAERIDHRTLEAQGIFDRLPQTHRGVSARMTARGEDTDRNAWRRQRGKANRILGELAGERNKTEAEAKPYREYFTAMENLTVALSDKATLQAALEEAITHEKTLMGELDTLRAKMRSADKEAENLRASPSYRLFHPLEYRRKSKQISTKKQSLGEREAKQTEALDAIRGQKADTEMRLNRLKTPVEEFFLSLNANGQVVRKNALESVSEAFKQKAKQLWRLWEGEIETKAKQQGLTPIELERLKNAVAEGIAENPDKALSPAESKAAEMRKAAEERNNGLIDLRGLAPREAGRKLFAATQGDLKHWELMEASAKAAGFVIDRTRLEAVQGKPPLEMQEALMKAVRHDRTQQQGRNRGRGFSR